MKLNRWVVLIVIAVAVGLAAKTVTQSAGGDNIVWGT